jgi:hypothetical protein
VRFSVNKLLGMEEEEEGMEPQYRTVLCRESLFVPADVELHAKDGHRDGSGSSTSEDAHAQPPLLLETSHFYPKGFHSTPLPVIIVRTPYDRALMRHTAERIVRHGYHVLVQDTRNSPNAAALKVKQQQKLRAAAKAVMAANTIAAAPATAAAAQPSSSSAASAPAAACSRSIAVDPLQAQYVQQPKSKPSSCKSSAGGSTPPRKHSGSATSSAAAAAVAAVDAAAAAGASASTAHPPVTAGPQEFFPIVHESADGLATMDWVTKQPWCDGNISFFGFSYLGQRVAAALRNHSWLSCTPLPTFVTRCRHAAHSSLVFSVFSLRVRYCRHCSVRRRGPQAPRAQVHRARDQRLARV